MHTLKEPPLRPGNYTSYKNWFLNNLFEIAHNYTLDSKGTLKAIKANSNEASVLKLVLPKIDLLYAKNKELLSNKTQLTQKVEQYNHKTFKQNLLVRDIVQKINSLPSSDIKTLLMHKAEELVNSLEVVNA